MFARRIQVGTAVVSVFNIGDLSFRLRDIERSPESEWRPRYGELFDRRLRFPSQSVHIATEGASILVDAGDYALFSAADPSYSPADYVPPPPLATQMEEIGVGMIAVTHLVITHAHYDHYAGVTYKVDGRYLPLFPEARHLLGRADWDNPEMEKALSEVGSPEAVSLGILKSSALLDLVEGERKLTPGVRVIASPGESPGHQIVKVQSEGETLYCLGDLFHHAVEVEDINLMSSWCDALANKKSRKELIRAALDEDAVLVAAHVEPGRLSGTTEAAKFVPV